MPVSVPCSEAVAHILSLDQALNTQSTIESAYKGLKKQNSKGWIEGSDVSGSYLTHITAYVKQVDKERRRLVKLKASLAGVAKNGLDPQDYTDKKKIEEFIRKSFVLSAKAYHYSDLVQGAIREIQKFLKDEKAIVVAQSFFGSSIYGSVIQSEQNLREFRSLLDDISKAADQAMRKVGKDSEKARKKK